MGRPSRAIVGGEGNEWQGSESWRRNLRQTTNSVDSWHWLLIVNDLMRQKGDKSRTCTFCFTNQWINNRSENSEIRNDVFKCLPFCFPYVYAYRWPKKAKNKGKVWNICLKIELKNLKPKSNIHVYPMALGLWCYGSNSEVKCLLCPDYSKNPQNLFWKVSCIKYFLYTVHIRQLCYCAEGC